MGERYSGIRALADFICDVTKYQHHTHHRCSLEGVQVLVFCNITNKICKRTDTAVAFTQEYSRVSYSLSNVSTLSTGSGSSKDTCDDVEKTEEGTFYI